MNCDKGSIADVGPDPENSGKSKPSTNATAGGHDMQRLLGPAMATALMLSATLARANQITDYVTNVDASHNRVMVGGVLFTANPNNAVGTPVEEFKVGDKVTVSYQTSTGGALEQRERDRRGRPTPMAAAQPLAGYVQRELRGETPRLLQPGGSGPEPAARLPLRPRRQALRPVRDGALQVGIGTRSAISNVAYLADQCQTDIESKCAIRPARPGSDRPVSRRQQGHADPVLHPGDRPGPARTSSSEEAGQAAHA